MPVERYSIIGIVFSVIIVLIDLYLLKNRKISGGTFTRWFIIGFGIGIASLVPAVFTFLYMILGTEVLISAVTVTSFMVLLLLIFHMDYRLNSLNDKVMKLVVELSAYKHNPKRKKGGRKEAED